MDDTKKREVIHDLKCAFQCLKDSNIIEFEVHFKENADYLQSLGYRIEQINDDSWWVIVEEL